MKFGELWKNVEISWYFKGPALSAFFYELRNNFSEWAQISHACFWWWFKYVLQVWWNLVNFEKMLKFHDISRAGTVSIFLWNKSTSLNGLKFHMHVSDDDSNKFCKFDEIWWTLKKCWNFMIFLGPALSAFFFEISQLLWMGSNFTCMFLMMIPINSASLMKFGELWKNVEISWYFKGPALSAFFYELS